MHEVPPGDTVQDGILARDLVGDSARDVPDPGSAGRSMVIGSVGYVTPIFPPINPNG